MSRYGKTVTQHAIYIMPVTQQVIHMMQFWKFCSNSFDKYMY